MITGYWFLYWLYPCGFRPSRWPVPDANWPPPGAPPVLTKRNAWNMPKGPAQDRLLQEFFYAGPVFGATKRIAGLGPLYSSKGLVFFVVSGSGASGTRWSGSKETTERGPPSRKKSPWRFPGAFFFRKYGYFCGLPSTSAKKVSSISLPSAMFWRYLMKSITSWPVIFLVLKAPKPRKASPIMLAASQWRL